MNSYLVTSGACRSLPVVVAASLSSSSSSLLFVYWWWHRPSRAYTLVSYWLVSPWFAKTRQELVRSRMEDDCSYTDHGGCWWWCISLGHPPARSGYRCETIPPWRTWALLAGFGACHPATEWGCVPGWAPYLQWAHSYRRCGCHHQICQKQ